jgi:protein-L-isoaspartate(D-aspartate) O-methyltransferase
VGVELVPELTEWGADNLSACHLPWARIEQAQPGVLGWPDDAPYDRILVSAEPQSLPAQLVDQMADDGVMVIPVAGRMLRVYRPGGAEPVIEKLGHYRFVPLRQVP